MKENQRKLVEAYPDDEMLFADGFDGAILGYDKRSGRVIYSIAECINILCVDMDEEDAMDHFYYNVEGGWVGEKTPIWCNDFAIKYDV